MIHTPDHRIIISPAGDVDSPPVNEIAGEIRRIFWYQTEITTLLEDISFALDPHRNQYYSTLILDALAGTAPPNALRVVGLVGVDLFIPVLTHVYGEAQLGGRSCIVSTYRLKEDTGGVTATEQYTARVVKEILHELGHTFGLRHCSEPTCLMHYCRTMRDVDRKERDLCRYCSVLLQDELNRIANG